MRVPFILNGEQAVVEAGPGERLITILRRRFHLTGLKEGCRQGVCGNCLIFLNARLVPACLIPVFSAFNSTILTIEGLSVTADFKDIEKGFLVSGTAPCGICASAVVMTTHALLNEIPNPTDDIVRERFSGIRCRCMVLSSLQKGVATAAEMRRQRIHGK